MAHGAEEVGVVEDLAAVGGEDFGGELEVDDFDCAVGLEDDAVGAAGVVGLGVVDGLLHEDAVVAFEPTAHAGAAVKYDGPHELRRGFGFGCG